MTLVLADGSIVKTRHRQRKSVAGYDLTSLIICSEGTLALVTEAVLKLTSTPRNLHVAVATFFNTAATVKTAVVLIGSGLPIDAIELIDEPSMGAINQSGLSSKHWKEVPTLFLKFSGSAQIVESQLKITRGAAGQNQCESFEASSELDNIRVLWGARKVVGRSLNALKKDPTDLFLHADVAVPISSLAGMIEEACKVITDAGLLL